MAWNNEEDLGEALLQRSDDLLQQTRVFPQLRFLLRAHRQQITQQKDLLHGYVVVYSVCLLVQGDVLSNLLPGRHCGGELADRQPEVCVRRL